MVRQGEERWCSQVQLIIRLFFRIILARVVMKSLSPVLLYLVLTAKAFLEINAIRSLGKRPVDGGRRSVVGRQYVVW